ncbi:MAG: fused MFS/spermidine synthase [Pseudomonadota bacterium]
MHKPLINKLATVVFIHLLFLVVLDDIHAKILHTQKSLYHHILVEEKNGKRCLKFQIHKNLTSNQSCIFLHDKNQFALEYAKLVMGTLLLNPNPQNVLVIGLGAGTIPMALNTALPQAKVTSVELDSAVFDVAKKHFDFSENENNKVVIMDARFYVRKLIKEKVNDIDLIILDAFSGHYIPEHLMTKQFLNEIKRICSNNCIVAANTFSSSTLAKYEAATYLHVFNSFILLSSQHTHNRIIITAKNLSLLSGENILNNKIPTEKMLALFDLDFDYLTHHFTRINGPAIEQFVLSDNFSPVNLLKKIQ